MATEFQGLRNKINRHDSLEQELANFKRFQAMSADSNIGCISITKHQANDSSIDPRRNNQTVFFREFSSFTKEAFEAFINKHIASLELELIELKAELSNLNKGI